VKHEGAPVNRKLKFLFENYRICKAVREAESSPAFESFYRYRSAKRGWHFTPRVEISM